MAANSGCSSRYVCRQHVLPYCLDPSDLKNPEVKQKFDDGPLAYITMMPNGVPAMGPKLIGMFVYFFVVAIIANNIALVPESIWFDRPWSMTAKNFLDALIYSVLTGGVFGWLV